METKELPPGFTRADEMPPAVANEEQKRKPGEREVYTLRDALDLFRENIPCRTLSDVKLEGIRVGVIFIKEASNEKYLVLFKREPYYHFSKHFPDVPTKGYGMIANLKLVHWCALEGIRMAAILKDGRCYWIDSWEFYTFYEKHKTDLKAIPGEIASPLSMWKRLF